VLISTHKTINGRRRAIKTSRDWFEKMDDCVNRKTWDPNLLQFSVTHNIHHYGDFHATQWQKNGDNNVQNVKKYFLLIESVI